MKNECKVEEFANTFYKQGESAMESFGMSWETLSDLEEKVPELTCKTSDNSDNKDTSCHTCKVALNSEIEKGS